MLWRMNPMTQQPSALDTSVLFSNQTSDVILVIGFVGPFCTSRQTIQDIYENVVKSVKIDRCVCIAVADPYSLAVRFVNLLSIERTDYVVV